MTLALREIDCAPRTQTNRTKYAYDALGNVTKKDHKPANGIGWASLVYDDSLRPHALKRVSSTDASRTLDFEYDAAGNVTRKLRTGFQGAVGQGASNVDFTYDSAGRMTVLAASNGASATFAYAADGRRLTTRRGLYTVALPEPDYEYHLNLQRVNKHFFVAGVRVASSARTWSAPSASLPWLLTWRTPDLPELPLGALGVGYAALGLLLLGVALRRRGRDTRSGSLALRLGSAGTLLVIAPTLLASPCGVGPPPLTTGVGTHDEPALFYLTDHLGSTILTIEDGGTARNRYYYLPFGDPGIASEGPSLRHRFTGEEILEGTGLYLLGARVYDPETGRFLQPDPLVANPADPQSFNRYTYALNNPVRWIDPSGLAPTTRACEDSVQGCGGGGEPAGGSGGGAPAAPPVSPFGNNGTGNVIAGLNRWHADFFDFLAGNPFSGLTALAAGPREGVGSQWEKSPSEIAAIAIFQNREVPEDVVNQIGREELVGFAELRVTIAELTRQPGADRTRLELGLAKSDLRIGLVEIAASLSTSAFGVLSPARTPAQIARDLPGVLLGPESQAARQGAQRFLSGLEGIKAIVRSPIGKPIQVR